MKGYHSNLVTTVIENENFRQVLYTGKFAQLVMMALRPGEEIGEEIHQDHDQYFRFESGEGVCMIDGNEYKVSAGHGIFVPSGSAHNIINKSEMETLQFLTIYGPPEHADGTIHPTKEQAISSPRQFDGVTTE